MDENPHQAPQMRGTAADGGARAIPRGALYRVDRRLNWRTQRLSGLRCDRAASLGGGRHHRFVAKHASGLLDGSTVGMVVSPDVWLPRRFCSFGSSS